MKKVFICANYMGLEENYFKILNYCKYIASKGFIPITTATMYHSSLNENIPQENKIITTAAKVLLSICDEVWVFGNCSETVIADMAGSGKPVVYVKESYSLNDASEQISVIMREYEVQTGRTVNRSIMESVLYYLNLGISDKLIIAAIKKTAKANAGWNYTEGILRNCVSRGITTLEEFSKNKAPRKQEDLSASYDIDLYEQMLNNDV